MPKLRLTKAAIDRLAATERDVIHWDSDLSGFGLKVTPTGRKVFLVQYRPSGERGNPRKYTIGDYGPFTLHQARVAAQQVLAARAMGKDPQRERRETRGAKAADRVADLVEEFLAKHVSQNRSARETERILRREVLPAWGGTSIHDLSKRDIALLLAKVRDRGASIMANRVLAAVRKFLNWCAGQGILATSPAAGIAAPSRELTRDRVLSDEELARINGAARKMGFPYGAIVEFLALTGQRRDEVAAARWEEIDLDRRTWTIPGSRSKNRKPHLVHLSDRAIAVLEALPRVGPLVFSFGPAPFSGWSKAKTRIDRFSGVTGWRIHDLRRTAVTGMARLGIAQHVADKVLNHQTGVIGGVAAVYQRHEFMPERKHALELWGEHVGQLPRVVLNERADNSP